MNCKASILFLFLLVFGASLSAFAEDQAPQPAKALATWVKRGEQMILVFEDGREATLTQTTRKPTRLSISLRQIENTCAPAAPLTQCQMKFDVSPLFVEVLWSKHPDQQKIGQVVQFKFTNPGMGDELQRLEEKDFNLLFWTDTKKFPQYQNLFTTKDEVVCDSFDWLKLAQKRGNNYLISSWAAEQMLMNDEIKIDENMSSSAHYDVELALANEKSAIIENAGIIYNPQTDAVPGYISSQVVNLTFMNQKNEFCQVSFESTLGPLVATLQSPEFMQVNAATRRTDIRLKRSTTERLLNKTNLLTSPNNRASVKDLE